MPQQNPLMILLISMYRMFEPSFHFKPTGTWIQRKTWRISNLNTEVCSLYGIRLSLYTGSCPSALYRDRISLYICDCPNAVYGDRLSLCISGCPSVWYGDRLSLYTGGCLSALYGDRLSLYTGQPPVYMEIETVHRRLSKCPIWTHVSLYTRGYLVLSICTRSLRRENGRDLAHE